MIIDKIIAQGCTKEVEDISPQVRDNQETNSLSDDVVLRPRGWIHIWSKEVVIGNTENQVHCSPWCVTQETTGARQSLGVRAGHQMSLSAEPLQAGRSQGETACVTWARLLSCSPQVWNCFVCSLRMEDSACFSRIPGVGCLQLSREEETSWCILNSYLP